MVNFHQATKSDVEMIAGMMASSFATYPFVANFLQDVYRSESERTMFLEKMSGILIRALMRNCIFPYVKQQRGNSI